jgi:hypothetical protein
MVNPPSFLLSRLASRVPFSRLSFHFRPAAHLIATQQGSVVPLRPQFGAHIPLLADHYGPAEIVFVSNTYSPSPGPLTPAPMPTGAVPGAAPSTHRPWRHQMVCIQTRRCLSRHRRDRSPRAHDAHAHSPAGLPPGQNKFPTLNLPIPAVPSVCPSDTHDFRRPIPV